MKTTNNNTAINFRNNSRVNGLTFPVAPAFSGFGFRRFSAECSQKLAELKERIAAELAKEFSAVNARLIRQAVNEADSLAATTAFPGLFLPALAEEKARSISAWSRRQAEIRAETFAFAA